MNRTEYLRNPDVKAFIDHLAASFESSSFSHSWVSYDKKSTGIDVGERWCCCGIRGAIENYYWPSKDPSTGEKITTLADTEYLLGGLTSELHDAIKVNDSEAARVVCRKVLRWGGVEGKPHVAVDMKDENFDLLGLLKRVKSHCELGSFDLKSLVKSGEPWLKIDSGTTKVYSLLLPGFAMLDSRVGCALAVMVSQFWQNRGHELGSLPPLLRFAWGGEVSRNPNPGARGQRFFPKLENSGVARAEQNFQVSWLLGAVAERLSGHAFFSTKSQVQVVRELEAGLFMIGYGVEHSERAPGEKRSRKSAKTLPSKKVIARGVFESGKDTPLSRGEFIEQCIEHGINPNTASTYFAEFNRLSHGLA